MQENTQDQKSQSQQNTIPGVDLKHPPSEVVGLSDTGKRFIAGMVRESYASGLDECQRTSSTFKGDRPTNLKKADQWLASSIPFLQNVIGDSGYGSNR